MGKRVEFKVSLELPEGATVSDARAYVREAVSAWCGSLKPITAVDPSEPDDWYDPMSDLDSESVRVTHLRKP